jgi:hypothetical protein
MPLAGQLLDQAFDLVFVLAVGLLERRHLVVHESLELAGAPERARDRLVHERDLPAHGLAQRCGGLLGGPIGLGQAHRHLGHGRRHQLGALARARQAAPGTRTARSAGRWSPPPPPSSGWRRRSRRRAATSEAAMAHTSRAPMASQPPDAPAASWKGRLEGCCAKRRSGRRWTGASSLAATWARADPPAAAWPHDRPPWAPPGLLVFVLLLLPPVLLGLSAPQVRRWAWVGGRPRLSRGGQRQLRRRCAVFGRDGPRGALGGLALRLYVLSHSPVPISAPRWTPNPLAPTLIPIPGWGTGGQHGKLVIRRRVTGWRGS